MPGSLDALVDKETELMARINLCFCRRWAVLLLILLVAGLHISCQSTGSSTLTSSTQPASQAAMEEKIFEFGSKYKCFGVMGDVVAFVSPGARHIAMRIYDEAGISFMMIDGKIDSRDCFVDGLTYSADSNHLAYVATKEYSQFVVLDGKEYPEYHEVQDVRLSSDGSVLAYAARKDAEWFIVVNGQVSQSFDGVSALVLSPDGKRFGYFAGKGDKVFCIIDGKIVNEAEAGSPLSADCLVSVSQPILFSPDSSKVAYCNGVFGVVLDGKQMAASQMARQSGKLNTSLYIYELAFSPDGKRFVFLAADDRGAYMVEDGKEGPIYEGFDYCFRPAFSTDSKHLAYCIFHYDETSPLKAFVVLDNKIASPEYGEIFYLSFRPGTTELAYSVDGASGKGPTQFVVIGGREKEKYRSVGGVEFSPDGKNFAYPAKVSSKDTSAGTADEWVVILDDKAGRKYSWVSKIVFSPQGLMTYYGIRDKTLYRVTTNVAGGSRSIRAESQPTGG